MADISQGNRAELILNPGDVYRVSTGGTATVEAVYGAPAGTTTVTASSQDFGPYGANAKLIVRAVTGSCGYTLRSDREPVLYQSGRLVTQGGEVVGGTRSAPLPSRAAALIGAPVVVSGGRATVGRSPKSYVPLDPRVEATQYYVDITNGNDANTGLSWAQAFKSIWKATTAGNTAAVPYTVNIAAGRYNRNNAFSNAGPTVTPTQSCVYRAVGGRVECYVGADLTWSLNSGTTYQATRSNAKRVIDWVNFDEKNDYREYTQVASLAACQATPGTWYTDNVTLYVNRIDGAAVTNANTAALLITVEAVKMTTSGSMHLYGISQYGGANGAVQLIGNVNGGFYAEDCDFSYSTNATAADNVTGLDVGLVVMNRCVSKRGQKDGFNYHTNSGSVPKAIHFDCIAYENGTVVTSTSNNGATIHDGGVMLDLNGRYFNNYGADFAHAGAGTMAVGVCTVTYGSYGDLSRGGVAQPGSGFHAVDQAAIYKIDCIGADQVTANGAIYSL